MRQNSEKKIHAYEYPFRKIRLPIRMRGPVDFRGKKFWPAPAIGVRLNIHGMEFHEWKKVFV